MPVPSRLSLGYPKWFFSGPDADERQPKTVHRADGMEMKRAGCQPHERGLPSAPLSGRMKFLP